MQRGGGSFFCAKTSPPVVSSSSFCGSVAGKEQGLPFSLR